MKRLSLLTYFAVLAFSAALAIPAKRGVYRTITLPDGSMVKAELRGDEYLHYYKTADGRAFEQVDNQFRLIERETLETERNVRIQARNVARANETNRLKYSGTRRGLVILVNFQDVKFTYSREVLDSMFNQKGFNLSGMAGSVHDYFYEQSYGNFDLEFDVVGPVTVSNTAEYYSKQKNFPRRVPDMVYEACSKVDSQVNFKKYDWDNNGEVDQVFLVYAGYSAAQGAVNTIWPHEWTLYASSNGSYRTGDNVYVATYGLACEMHGDGIVNPGNLDGIGTACHEFSHCLGLPDFYDTREDGNNFGMNVWSLMDYGCYNNDGRSPAGYTAYERWVSGWLEPVELNTGEEIINMPAIQDEPVAYIIYNDANKNEYYMLENYQRKSFDKSGYGHGLLVMHVDYSKSAWDGNTVNTDTLHQRMTIIAADNAYTTRTLTGDTYPGTRQVTSLADNTTPAATLYNKNVDGKKFMGKPITNIVENNGLISFDFMGGLETYVPVDAPVVLDATDVSPNSFMANWNSVEGAKKYNLLLIKELTYDGNSIIPIFEEYFEKFSNGVTIDVTDKLDEYTTNPGWSGKNLFTTPQNKLRIGKKDYPGELLSPEYEAPIRDSITIYLTVNSPIRNAKAALQLRVYPMNLGDDIEFLNDNNYYIPINVGEIPPTSVGKYALSIKLPWYADYGPIRVAVYPDSNGSGVLIDYLAVYDGVEGSVSQSLSQPIVRRTTQMFTTLDTSYGLTNLEPAKYYYKVQALGRGGSVSEWSDEVAVDLTTAIHPISVVSKSGDENVMYDIMGRIVSNPAKGLYIRNGRKYLVK